MKCTVCDTEFEGDFCPACATPASKPKEKNKQGFYKDPWFWISFMLFICLMINSLKPNVEHQSEDSSSYSSAYLQGFFSEPTSSVSTSEKSESIESSSKTALTDSTTVYITPSGKRYHISAKCAGKNASATKLEKAKNDGKTPCKKCLK